MFGEYDTTRPNTGSQDEDSGSISKPTERKKIVSRLGRRGIHLPKNRDIRLLADISDEPEELTNEDSSSHSAIGIASAMSWLRETPVKQDTPSTAADVNDKYRSSMMNTPLSGNEHFAFSQPSLSVPSFIPPWKSASEFGKSCDVEKPTMPLQNMVNFEFTTKTQSCKITVTDFDKGKMYISNEKENMVPRLYNAPKPNSDDVFCNISNEPKGSHVTNHSADRNDVKLGNDILDLSRKKASHVASANYKDKDPSGSTDPFKTNCPSDAFQPFLNLSSRGTYSQRCLNMIHPQKNTTDLIVDSIVPNIQPNEVHSSCDRNYQGMGNHLPKLIDDQGNKKQPVDEVDKFQSSSVSHFIKGNGQFTAVSKSQNMSSNLSGVAETVNERNIVPCNKTVEIKGDTDERKVQPVKKHPNDINGKDSVYPAADYRHDRPTPSKIHPVSAPSNNRPTPSKDRLLSTSSNYRPTHSFNHPVSAQSNNQMLSAPYNSRPASVLSSDSISAPSSNHPIPAPSSNHPISAPSNNHPMSAPSSNHPISAPSSNHPISVPSNNHPMSAPSSNHLMSVPSSNRPMSVQSSNHPIAFSSSQQAPSNKSAYIMPQNKQTTGPSLSSDPFIKPSAQKVPQRSVKSALQRTLSTNRESVAGKHGSLLTKKTASSLEQLYVNKRPYGVISTLGRGGSSEVFLVLEEKSSKLLAIKYVNLSQVDNLTAESYLNEVELLLKLQDCETVIRMWDHEYVEDEKILYVVMEKGDTDFSKFLQSVNKTKKVQMAMILYYWTEMLYAVKDIHDRGIIHADLKPGNFLLVKGRLKLIDFGIASSLQGDMTSVQRDVPTGTYNYMSPEAISNNAGSGGGGGKTKISYKSDVWSLGCILYSLVYGKTPFAHITSMWTKLSAIVDTTHEISFPEKTEHRGRIPQVLLKTLKNCLTRDPKLRPSVEELLRYEYCVMNYDNTDQDS